MLQFISMRQDRGVDWFDDGVRDPGVSTLVLASYGRSVFWIEQEKVILEKGETLFIPAGQSFYGKCIPTVFHEKYVIAFTGAVELEGLPLAKRTAWVKTKLGAYDLCLERLKGLYADWSDNAPYASFRGLSVLLEWLAVWNRELDKGPLSPETHQAVERMKQYITANYQQKITKETLGDYIHKSPNYCAALFCRITGQTISEYVHATRMKKASYMLVDSTLTVGEIAEFVGYSDVSYFQRIFKRETGMTPTEYRRERPAPSA
ncbi:AraC family transcriptional regulator [Paenibacillus sp. NEAU-GSW1]|uniref:helix-turn-helix domain-containing protein n=1 Tax=Paenibacillus sp. NEAU-GSW1 TaxID=2682486 RepID=UPI0012E2FD1A|nr:AraC family transcriptional regulator [Paenibacillus sp. NEAU-GSW1]MUT68649.1 helix-turn-helix domain-containing protein [Paenibacillus sp. NEAU-GSW1]